MKKTMLIAAFACLILSACGTKKEEVKTDSTAVVCDSALVVKQDSTKADTAKKVVVEEVKVKK